MSLYCFFIRVEITQESFKVYNVHKDKFPELSAIIEYSPGRVISQLNILIWFIVFLKEFSSMLKFQVLKLECLF